MRKSGSWLALGLAVLFLLASSPMASVSSQPTEIRVGVAISLSGKYDVLGQRGYQGAKLWADWVNQQGGIEVREWGTKLPVRLLFYDDKSDRDTVLKLTERLIVEDKVNFIIGPYGSGLNLAAAPITERYGILLFSHAGASDRLWEQGYRYVIGVLTPSSGYYKSVIEMLKTLQPSIKTVAFVTEDEPFNKSIRVATVKLVKEAGYQIVADEIYPENPTDLSPIVSKLKAVAPDAVLASSHFRDGVLLAKQMAELGVKPKFLAFGSAPSTLEWWDAAGATAASYTVATSQWDPVDFPKPAAHRNWYGPRLTARGYNEWFKKTYGKGTDFRGVQSFAAGLVLQWGIERAGLLSTKRVREALNAMDIITFYGRSKIDAASGIQVAHEMVVSQWQSGKLVTVWPPAIAEGKLVYPRK